jgi:hypothetical protein
LKSQQLFFFGSHYSPGFSHFLSISNSSIIKRLVNSDSQAPQKKGGGTE